MKKLVLLALLSLTCFIAKADFIRFQPVNLTQPNGEAIHCFASGDEFYNRLHDAEGYTIVQASDGYYYYAMKSRGKLKPSKYKVGSVNPQTVGLEPNLIISQEDYLAKKKSWNEGSLPISKALSTGDINAVTIYIRFSDDAEFTAYNITQHHQKFDDSTGYSVRNYYRTVSYGQLDIHTTHIPENKGGTISSYVDPNPRGYYQPYNATTNTIGYRIEAERTLREWTLLQNAIIWARTNHPLPADLDIDKDRDGYADLVAFVIKGNNDGWSDLLWAHKWQLGSGYQEILSGTVKVGTFTFQPEQQTSVRTISHENFHAFGAPDLYHYNYYTDLNPAGPWDIMESGYGHMSAYLKLHYGGWISYKGTITEPGRYTLKSQGKNKTGNIYKIATKSLEFFTLEYRKQTDDQYESYLPGSGLIVARVDQLYNGNAGFNGTTSLDGFYIVRPGGSKFQDGSVSQANLSNSVGRSIMGKGQAIVPFYNDNTEAQFIIYNIEESGDSVSFNVMFDDFAADNFKVFKKNDSLVLTWSPRSTATDFVLLMDTLKHTGYLDENRSYTIGDVLASGQKVIYVGADSTCSVLMEAETTHYFQLFTRKNNMHSLPDNAQYTVVDQNVSYDTLSNDMEGDQFTLYRYSRGGVNYGYATGHNADQIKSYAEYFENDKPGSIIGTYLCVGKAHSNNSNSKVEVFVKGAEAGPLVGSTLYYEKYPIMNMTAGAWNRVIFETPVFTQDDFFVGIGLNYDFPQDTFALYSTKANALRGLTSYYSLDNKGYGSIYQFVDGLYISLGIRPIIKYGPYIGITPHILTPPAGRDTTYQLDVFTSYGDFDVQCEDAWVDYTVNGNTITIDIAANTGERSAEMIIYAGEDTTRCFIQQGGTPLPVEEIAELDLTIFPNPSKDGIFYFQSYDENLVLEIFDLFGRRILQKTLRSDMERIDLSAQPNGFYIGKVRSGEKEHSFKLIKQ